MQGAVLLSIGRFICTVPWFVICCVPFYPQRRVSRAVMVFVISTVSIFFFLCNFFFSCKMKIIFVTAVLCFSYYMQLCSACFYGGSG